jgi:hypothetical protein
MVGSEIVRNLLGGISQQPEDLRAPNQAKEARNMVFDPVDGASKRYPTNHVAHLEQDRQNQKHLFSMDRDDEQYLIWAGDGECDVYTKSGVQVPVLDQTNSGGNYSLRSSTTQYLDGDRDTLRSQVIVDTAFIANTTKEVVAGQYDAITPTWREIGDRGQDCFANVFVRQFNWSSTVTVRWKVEGYDPQEVTYSTPANKTEHAGSHGTWNTNDSVCETKAETSPYSGQIPPGSGRAGWKVEWGSFSANTKEPGKTPVCDAPEQLFAHTSGSTTQSASTYKHGDFEYDVASRIARLKPGITDPEVALHFGWNQVHDPDYPDVRKTRTSGAGPSSVISRSFPIRADYVAEILKEKIMEIDPAVSGIDASYPQVEDSSGSGWFMLQTRPDEGEPKPFEVFEVTDNVDNAYALGWTTEVEEISDLPLVCRHGAVARVVSGEAGSEYYVAFRTEKFVRDEYTVEAQWPNYDHVGKGNWVEFVPGQRYPRHDSEERKDALSKFTMPHIIKRIVLTQSIIDTWAGMGVNPWPSAQVGDIGFSVQPYDSWDPRLVGDNENNKAPSFVDNTISDIFFWQGRLGFLSNDNIILSEAGNPDNFWRTTQLSVPDSERIDVASTENQGKTLRYAVPLDERLMVFSDDTQIVVTSNGPLSPQTVQTPVASMYEALDSAPPILFGQSVLMPYKNHGFVGLRELVPLDNRDNFAAVDLTAAVSRLIAVDATADASYKVVASTSENIVFVHSSSEPEKMYIFKYVKGGQGEYSLANWSEWVFKLNVLDFIVLDDALYLIFDNSNQQGETTLERLDLGSGQDDNAVTESNTPWLMHIDRKYYWNADAGVSASYDQPNDETTFIFSFSNGMYMGQRALGLKAYTEDGTQLDDTNISDGRTSNPNNANYVVKGDYRNVPLWFGVPYTMQWEANRNNRRIPATGGSTPRMSRRTINNSCLVGFDRTGYFDVIVAYQAGATYVTNFGGDASNNRSSSNITRFNNTEFLRSGVLPVSIHGANYNVALIIRSASPLPCNLTTLEWNSEQNPQHTLRGVW